MVANKLIGPNASDVTGPSPRMVEVTPADTTLAEAFRQVRVGTSDGTQALTVKDDQGTSITFENVAQGEVFLGWFTEVSSTGTTVSDIVGWT